MYIYRTCSPVSPNEVVYDGSDEMLNDDISLEYDMEEAHIIREGVGYIFPGIQQNESCK